MNPYTGGIVNIGVLGSFALTGCTGPSFAGATDATVVSDHEVSLTWRAAVDPTTPASGILYSVCKSEVTGSCATDFVNAQTTAPGVTATTLTDLKPDTTYYFLVRARNAFGQLDANQAEVSAHTCATGDEVCGGACTSVASDRENCGACHSRCINQACVDGLCQGQCEPGLKQCSGKTPQLCSSTGQWEDAPACGSDAICSSGTCMPCPGSGGPTMVGLPLGYCIDTTEITRAQYLTWLRTNPSTQRQIAQCTWNSTYTPSGDWSAPDSDRPNHPVAYVDWCDAYAYCTGVGKRLCGKIGGGPNDTADRADASKSQWYAACSSNGAYAYPYGSAYQMGTCNDAYAGHADFVDVATMPGCSTTASGYAGVYDLSGNIFEWEDSCRTAFGMYLCNLRGGYVENALDVYLECGFVGSEGSHDTSYPNVGIRCCAP